MSQKMVTYKVRVNRPCRLFIDDEEVAILDELRLTKFELPEGEYLRRVVAIDNCTIFHETVIRLDGSSKIDIIELDITKLHEIKYRIVPKEIFKVDNLYYKVKDDCSLEITYSVDDRYKFTEIQIPSFVTYMGYQFAVTSIGDDAFSGKNLQRISIPNSIEYISDSAFFLCYMIKKNILYDKELTDDNRFYGCTLIDEEIDGMLIKDNTIISTREELLPKSITIPGHIKKIGDGVFSRVELESVIVSYGVEVLGDIAFSGGTKEIFLPKSIKSIGELAFGGPRSIKITFDCYSHELEKIEMIAVWDDMVSSKFVKCLDREVELMI